jgi:hypothetical protein
VLFDQRITENARERSGMLRSIFFNEFSVHGHFSVTGETVVAGDGVNSAAA